MWFQHTICVASLYCFEYDARKDNGNSAMRLCSRYNYKCWLLSRGNTDWAISSMAQRVIIKGTDRIILCFCWNKPERNGARHVVVVILSCFCIVMKDLYKVDLLNLSMTYLREIDSFGYPSVHFQIQLAEGLWYTVYPVRGVLTPS